VVARILMIQKKTVTSGTLLAKVRGKDRVSLVYVVMPPTIPGEVSTLGLQKVQV